MYSNKYSRNSYVMFYENEFGNNDRVSSNSFHFSHRSYFLVVVLCRNNTPEKEVVVVADASEPEPSVCPDECSGNGVCLMGQCLCISGFIGDNCGNKDPINADKLSCKNECRGYDLATIDPSLPAPEPFGKCVRDRCFCYPGFTGADCSVPIEVKCLNDCGRHGLCQNGVCFCDAGYSGEGCEIDTGACAQECQNQSVCYMGRCNCMRGYEGEACGSKVSCPADCSGNGQVIIETRNYHMIGMYSTRNYHMIGMYFTRNYHMIGMYFTRNYHMIGMYFTRNYHTIGMYFTIKHCIIVP